MGKISPKKSNYPFLLKIDTQSIMMMLILILTLVFSNFKPKPQGYWLYSEKDVKKIKKGRNKKVIKEKKKTRKLIF